MYRFSDGTFSFLGHACAGTAGYCDVFGKCRAVDAEGPLTRLKNMLLSEANIRTLTELGQVRRDDARFFDVTRSFASQSYWWVLVLGLLGLIGLMSIFVKVCSVHTPSSNPHLKPARPLTQGRGVGFRFTVDSLHIRSFLGSRSSTSTSASLVLAVVRNGTALSAVPTSLRARTVFVR